MFVEIAIAPVVYGDNGGGGAAPCARYRTEMEAAREHEALASPALAVVGDGDHGVAGDGGHVLRAKSTCSATRDRQSCKGYERYSAELRLKGGGAAKASRRSCRVCSPELRAKGTGVAKAYRRSCKGCSLELQTLLVRATSEGWQCCKSYYPEMQRLLAGAASEGRRCCKLCLTELQRSSVPATKTVMLASRGN